MGRVEGGKLTRDGRRIGRSRFPLGRAAAERVRPSPPLSSLSSLTPPLGLNRAMTRPKRQLVVVGDSSTVSKGSGYLKRWMEWLEESAWVQVPE